MLNLDPPGRNDALACLVRVSRKDLLQILLRRAETAYAEGDRTMAERTGGEWHGSPLDVGGIDPYGIKEIIVEYDTGDEEILKPRLRDEYGAYELQQAAVYLGTLAGELRRSADM
jgi:hypothetical protein